MAARRTTEPRPLPTFDPVPSARFGLEVLDRSKARRALIGRVAMWYWLADEADHEYTKDVDFAVPRASLPAILEILQQTGAEVLPLTIGGVHARVAQQGIRTDFIDRSARSGVICSLSISTRSAPPKRRTTGSKGFPSRPPSTSSP